MLPRLRTFREKQDEYPRTFCHNQHRAGKKTKDETEESRSRRCFLHDKSNEKKQLISYVNKDFESSSILLNYEKRPV